MGRQNRGISIPFDQKQHMRLRSVSMWDLSSQQAQSLVTSRLDVRKCLPCKPEIELEAHSVYCRATSAGHAGVHMRSSQ